MIRRLLYLGYYFKQMQWNLLKKFLYHTSKKTKRSKATLIIESIIDVFLYNISILEYFQFGFYDKKALEKKNWAGTGFMYEYQLIMNPIDKRVILDDKALFYKNYNKFFVHEIVTIEDLNAQPHLAEKILSNKSNKLVFKQYDGKCGVGVNVVDATKFNKDSLVSYMLKENFDLVEEFIVQHPSLNELSPSAVNTIRVFTQLNKKNEVVCLGCRLRISVNSPVDNMAAGNLAAPINENTGKVIGAAVYSDYTKEEETVHPVTGIDIVGFQIPFWKEILVMVNEAALMYPKNRSIGWDIVVTENGPGFIEGNHDWCKLLWQLPVKKGLKSEIEKFK
tara:strand:+ start:284 stop:1288 length:1005 start_codon:yes stop_codon:yes gene_type:complete